MKQFTKENILLHDGDIYLTSGTPSQYDEYYFDDTTLLRQSVTDDEDYWSARKDYKLVIASTKQLEGVKQLDRSLFVKPDVDVEEMANYIINNFWHTIPSDGESIKEYEREKDLIKAGYNANKKEFTLEDMKNAFLEGYRQGTGANDNMSFEEILLNLKPLSIPSKISFDDNWKVTQIYW